MADIVHLSFGDDVWTWKKIMEINSSVRWHDSFTNSLFGIDFFFLLSSHNWLFQKYVCRSLNQNNIVNPNYKKEFGGFHHLEPMTSWKDSFKLDICPVNKKHGRNQHWMFVTFEPPRWRCIKNRHDSMEDVTPWVWEDFGKPVRKHSLPSHLQMHVKLLHSINNWLKVCLSVHPALTPSSSAN